MSSLVASPAAGVPARPVAAKPAHRPYRVRVAAVTPLSPSFVRLTFAGDDLADHSEHVIWFGPSEELNLSLFTDQSTSSIQP